MKALIIVFTLFISNFAYAECFRPPDAECGACVKDGLNSSTTQCTTIYVGNACDPSMTQCDLNNGSSGRAFERRWFKAPLFYFGIPGRPGASAYDIPRSMWPLFPTSGTFTQGFYKNVPLPVGEDKELGGKGHTNFAPQVINCYPSTAVGGMVCNSNTLGEAFGHAVEARMKVYGPNGRIFWMTVRHGVGRY